MARKNSERIAEYYLNHITDIAMKLFLEKGIESTSMEEIADYGTISKVTIYKYFPTKLDIVIGVVRKYLVNNTRYMSEELFNEDYYKKSGLEQVRMYLMVYAQIHQENNNILPFFSELDMLISKDKVSEPWYDEVVNSFSDYTRYFEEAFEKGIRDGSILKRIDNAKDLYPIYRDMIQGVYLKLYLRLGREYFINYNMEVYNTLKFVVDEIISSLGK